MAPAEPGAAKGGYKDTESMATGAFPTATFPCNHLIRQISPAGAEPNNAAWSRVQVEPIEVSLRQAVNDADWAGLFAEGKTTIQMQKEWSATVERCNVLRCFCSMLEARRVLEVGSFCGVASVAMSEVLPADGEVVALEIDPFPVEFGKDLKEKSPHYSKVKTRIGSAEESLSALAEAAPGSKPFDLVVIDADKARMRSYFDIVWDTPGLLSQKGSVCVDITPFKGQPPERYVKFGQADRWVENSGREEIDAFKSYLRGSQRIVTFEVQGMIVVRKAPADAAAALLRPQKDTGKEDAPADDGADDGPQYD